jgi:hypothetical protein
MPDAEPVSIRPHSHNNPHSDAAFEELRRDICEGIWQHKRQQLPELPQNVSVRRIAAIIQGEVMSDLETCANCDRKIGRLETAHLWQDRVVCAQCILLLQTAPASSQPPKVTPTTLRDRGEGNCAGCGAELTDPFVWDEWSVCESCHQQLAATEPPDSLHGPKAAIEFEDRALPLGPEPTLPLISITKMRNIAMMRVKITTRDPDTDETETGTVELRDGTFFHDLADVARRHGRRLERAVITERYWEQVDAPSAAEKGLITLGIASLFID